MKALLIVDMQNDFMPGGPLEVPGADQLVPIINKLIPQFPLVVASMDWHTADHIGFVSSHAGRKVGDRIPQPPSSEQILWPIHCVQNTKGAELARGLDRKRIDLFCYKGKEQHIDSYSAFFDNAKDKSTGLGDDLKQRGVTDLYLVGVATDYCVLYSALDALELGFRVFVVQDACRAINIHAEDEKKALNRIVDEGGEILTADQIK